MVDLEKLYSKNSIANQSDRVGLNFGTMALAKEFLSEASAHNFANSRARARAHLHCIVHVTVRSINVNVNANWR
jgi:hypothetical protein